MSTESRQNSRRVLANILSLAAGEAIARAIGFFATAHVAGALGPEGFGVIGFAAAFVGYFTQPVAAAFNDVGSREVARQPQAAATLAVSGVGARVVLSAAALPVYAVVALAAGRSRTAEIVLALSGLSLLSLALDAAWVYRGRERTFRTGVALLVGQGSYAAVILLAVRGPSDLFVVPVALAAGEVITGLVLLIPFLRGANTRMSAAVGIRLLRQMPAVIASRFLRTVFFTFEVVLLGMLMGNRAVGLYTAPYRIRYLAIAIGTLVNAAFLPALARGRDGDPEVLRGVVARSIEIASAAAAPVVAGGIVLAAPLLVAVFGPEYAEGAAAFQILLLSVVFTFLVGAVRNVLVAHNRTRLDLLMIGSGAVLNLALNFVLIPRFGIEGAAVATTLSMEASIPFGAPASSGSPGRRRRHGTCRNRTASATMCPSTPPLLTWT